MAKQEEIKRIERRARAMLLNKDIPPHKQELVRSLINNKRLKPKEKWRAVIDLVQGCTDKKVVMYDTRYITGTAVKKRRRAARRRMAWSPPAIFAPTETSYYIDAIYRKYRSLKLFKKRYLVRRPNRFRMGIRKRLIPTKKLIKLIELIAVAQNLILSRLDAVMKNILFDETIEDPVIFNYLQIIRIWMQDAPLLLREDYESVMWMERAHFDRAFRSQVVNFYSFLMLDAHTREKILAEVEARIRALGDLKKEVMNEEDPDPDWKEKEKRNLDREGRIIEYMMLIRSFLPVDAQQESMLARRLKSYYDFQNLSELYFMIEEALVFQRPLKTEEMIAYFGIKAPSASTTVWDARGELLKRAGKDKESLEQKKREMQEVVPEPNETLYILMKYEAPLPNLLLKAYADQLRYEDHKQIDPQLTYNDFYFNFLHGLLHYFQDMYIPLLDGSPIIFRDIGREVHTGSIFSPGFFKDELSKFNSIFEVLHQFINNNPGLVLTRDRVTKIMKGEEAPPAHADLLIGSLGAFFYHIGRELQHFFDEHRKWTSLRTRSMDTELARLPIQERRKDGDEGLGRPIPFYDCGVKELKSGSALTNGLIGERVLEDSLQDGIFVRMNAFAYQFAGDCLNENLLHDLDIINSPYNRDRA
jgi:hypothetical protein